ncbi:MAG: hypothetical protein HY434_02035 [Candidatus Liptonbacteria bacterium]|nr:hypothetical protein [Candidatus Liptonbacteria bacterium]
MPNESPWGTKPSLKRAASEEKSIGRGVFWLVGIIVLGIAAAGAYYFLQPQGANVGLDFSKPNQVLLGDPLTLSVSASNYSDGVLRGAKISLFLPEGVSFTGQPQSQRAMEQTLGDVGPGSINQQGFSLIVTSGPNSVKRIEAKLIYSTAGNPNTQFEHAQNVDLLVGQPAVSVNLSSPENVFSGEEFQVQITYLNNTGRDFKNLRLKIDYPPIFEFKRSSMATEDSSNNVWSIGTLTAGSGGNISVTGSIVGQEKSFFSFNGSVVADFLGVTYTINTQSANVAISPAPLSLGIVLSNGSDYVVRPGDMLDYALQFKNNSDVAMQNVNIKAKLIGEMFDFSSLQSGAAFDSLTNTVSWSPATTAGLSNVAPGASGSVDFRVHARQTFPIKFISDKNYTLKIQARIESPTVPQNTTAQKTVSVADVEHKVAGRLALTAEAYWRDAASGILNTGPYPPKVNKPTQYTVHWRLANYATDVSSIIVSAHLQSGARFTGKTKNTGGGVVNYDSNSGLVTWNIASVPATKGVVSAPLEQVFQIEVTPAINQVNQNIVFLSESKAEGNDVFTGLSISAGAPQLDSNLPYDKTIAVSDRTVKQ